MSGSEAAADRCNDRADCPLCLEPLPPFWDMDRRHLYICCGNETCGACNDKRIAFLDRKVDDGSFGKGEHQLGSFCPLCRTKYPDADCAAKMLKSQFDEGSLQLLMYRELACCYLHGRGGARKDIRKGMKILMLGAEKGEPECQNMVGEMYDDGLNGLPKSPKEAKRWFLAAAERGHAISEFHLAEILKAEGDYPEFLRHLRGSASKGFDIACYNLGMALGGGMHGVQKCVEEAIRVLTPAAERGHTQSMGLLAYVMCNPHPALPPPANPNFTKGMHWARRAAETGDQTSILSLGDLEEEANGVCFRCSEVAPHKNAFLRCSRCRAAWYCSKDCQVEHWKVKPGHKQFCTKGLP